MTLAELKPYVKAVSAGLVSAIAFLAPTVDDGLSKSELLGTVSAFVVGTGVTFYVPYQTTKKVDETAKPAEY
jgi:hypothetical protein